MNFERIITSVPINRTAAVVANGTDDEDAETPETRRKNLVKLVRQIERAIQASKDTERKKWLGHRKLDVQNLLKALPRKRVQGQDISGFIAEVAKERMTKAQFALIVDEAERRFEAAQAALETKPT